ncbi:hypothetical protein KBW71_03315 [Hydrogenophaga aromaticivorans]|uniref:hypothetical protein n=1 Tax=Hydrogenophaga aromaticivorans TaxID=2610898 RepID=UPI001B375357|nr:hypothetical protein [Hydrogenophaga aromaticivorans]MBQ0917458.1 hypothetical protein [Hydrogenophaga aromaticivorans]
MSKLADKLAAAQKSSTPGASGSLDAELSASAPAPENKAPDWERIGAQYRIGTMSLREIASMHGITEGAIRKRAKKEEWTRDLAAKVRAKADELVRKELVRSEVRKETATEKESIDTEAQVLARVRLTHRKDISKGRTLAMSLMEELEAQTGSAELMQKLGEIMSDPDKSGNDKKLAEAYQKAISLGGRVQTMRSLADTIRTLVSLEREAYGLDNMPNAPVDDISTMTDDDLDARISERLRVAGL